MPPIRVTSLRAQFEGDIDDVAALVTAAKGYRRVNSRGAFAPLPTRSVELITALAFLRLQLAWEDFVESVFVRYLCGGQTDSGQGPALLTPAKATLAVALAELLGKDKYLLWSSSHIDARARKYFDRGEPFVLATSVGKKELADMARVRNALAHRSDYAQQEFRRVVLSEVGYVPRGMTPGRFLLSSPGGTPQPMIDRYRAVYQTLAPLVVP